MSHDPVPTNTPNVAAGSPSTTAKQVRNLRSCLKVAVDFVAPESLSSVSELLDLQRRCPRDPQEDALSSQYQVWVSRSVGVSSA